MDPSAKRTENDREPATGTGPRRRGLTNLGSRSGLGKESPLFTGAQADTGANLSGSSADVYEIPREDESPLDLDRIEGLLPVRDPSRNVDDWGRSESFYGRVEPLLRFLYENWFRVECSGLENIPASGGAFIVGSSTEEIPPEAPMIAQAIRERFGNGRQLYMLSEFGLVYMPLLSTIATKLGVVSAHPANARRLLGHEHQLVLVFPEKYSNRGAQGRWPQKVTAFGRGGFVSIAIRSKSSIVPVAVAGSDDAFKQLEQLASGGTFGKIVGLPLRVLNRAQIGRLPIAKYLPVKIKIEFLEPVSFDQYGDDDAQDIALVQGHAEEIRKRIEEAHERMVHELV